MKLPTWAKCIFFTAFGALVTLSLQGKFDGTQQPADKQDETLNLYSGSECGSNFSCFVVTDPYTGVEYVVAKSAYGVSVTPRLDTTGNVMSIPQE